MKLFVLIATLAAYPYAASTFELLHLSPVNPDVLVAVKPEEKIVLVTDPKETAKFKRETKLPLYPTVIPIYHEHRLKRCDHDISNERNDIPLPLVALKQESLEEVKENGSHDYKKEENTENQKISGLQSSQELPLILKENIQKNQQQKRDIPVPLVPKHYRVEESRKTKESYEVGKEENLENQKLKEDIPDQLHKRDIPVPLMAKHHYFAESLQDNNDKASVDNFSESHKVLQVLAQDPNHITQVQSQGLTEALKATNNFSHQNKRESSASKDINLHEEVKIPNNRILQSHHQPQPLPNEIHKNITTPDFHKKQDLAIDPKSSNIKINQQHSVQKDSDQNEKEPQKESKANKENLSNDSEQHLAILTKNGEDITKQKQSQKPIHYTVSAQHDLKPNIKEYHAVDSDFVITSSEHPLIRQRPVPVAELFAG